jgi:pSer/pThr/pTyr-binding forkhead associated (FHA) protein
MKLKLLIKSKTGTQTVTLADAFSYTLGRKDAEVLIDDPRCSKAHALIYEGPDGSPRLKDLNSSNGTFLNGTKVAESPLNVGDEIRIGGTLVIALECPQLSTTTETGTGNRRPEPSHKPPSPEILNQWPDNLRSLPKKDLGDFLDFMDEDQKKQSVRLADLMKAKKRR